MLEQEFKQIAKQMQSQLEQARARYRHSGDIGTAAEDAFRGFLRQYLPRRLAVGSGEVVDSRGKRSGQVDVVVVNEDHPFTFAENLPGLFFVEGVTAAGEIKSVLTTQHLEQSITNSKRFKQLSINVGRGTETYTSPSDLKRYYSSPPYFLFAYESKLSLGSILGRLKREVNENGLVRTDLLDAVYISGRGWLVNFGDGEGSFQFFSTQEESLRGWHGNEVEEVLLPLMTWLSHVMPRFYRQTPVLSQYLLDS